VSLQKGEYFCLHSSLCKCLYTCISEYVTVCETIYVNIYRDALIAIYPNIQTLMCYFHVVNCCKKNLRSHPAAIQKLICDEIYNLHCSVSQQEFEGRYREVSARWRIDFPEFARYFNTQWISGHFTNWKIYCSAPGIASTNNALELFNNVIKRCYTLNARHSLSALVDLFMERLVFDISMDIMDLRKCYELCRLLSLEVKQKSEAIDESNYVIREERNVLVTYQKHGNVETYCMSCFNGTCTCRYYMKMGYCKHLLHAYALLNEDSDYVIIDCRFKYKGNTKITKRQRGRVRDALPALQVM
jgi:hypothetical protein